MELTVGAVLEGKVKSITNFGAFVALPENRTGMVHISEVANAYVSDIRQYLTEGQDVKVVVIGNENGKINLSIKRLEPKPQ
ncbi:MAG: S1 RNA-binding domain-containing protein, partial [Candidatus Faecousia sp.]|nr:S1 RNA-binding domain-containing protein [Candidatus Faecousia sp.]